MRDYVILTDSCCDLTAEMAEELGIVVLPLGALRKAAKGVSRV